MFEPSDDLPESLRAMLRLARDLKEARVAKTPGHARAQQFDLGSLVHVRRGGADIAQVFCETKRDAMLQAARVAIPGFWADEVLLVQEAWKADPDKWRHYYGHRPDPGEFQRIFLAGNPNGVILEAILVIRATRLGERQLIQLPYHRKRKTLTWRPDLADNQDSFSPGWGSDDYHDTAIIGRCLTEYFRLPSHSPRLPKPDPGDYGLTPQQARIHEDVATARVLGHAGFPVGLFIPDEETAAVLDRSIAMDPGLAGYVHPVGSEPPTEIPGAPDARPTVLNLLAPLMREKLAKERDDIHRVEERVAAQNRARRRAAKRRRR